MRYLFFLFTGILIQVSGEDDFAWEVIQRSAYAAAETDLTAELVSFLLTCQD